MSKGISSVKEVLFLFVVLVVIKRQIPIGKCQCTGQSEFDRLDHMLLFTCCAFQDRNVVTAS